MIVWLKDIPLLLTCCMTRYSSSYDFLLPSLCFIFFKSWDVSSQNDDGRLIIVPFYCILIILFIHLYLTGGFIPDGKFSHGYWSTKQVLGRTCTYRREGVCVCILSFPFWSKTGISNYQVYVFFLLVNDEEKVVLFFPHFFFFGFSFVKDYLHVK